MGENYETKRRTPLVSVVIPTYNSAKTIEACLASLAAQTYTNIEVIVVDNLSCDGTAQLASVFAVTVLEYQGSRTSARNHGVGMSRGSYVLNVDSDMILPKEIIEECVNICDEGDFDALILPEVSIGDGYFAGCRALQKSVFMNEPGYESARFITHEAFDEINGYDEKLEAGEDFDIHFRLQNEGGKISRSSAAVLHCEGRLSIPNIIRKARYYGRTVNVYSAKNRESIDKHAAVFEVYARRWRLLTQGMKFLPGLLLMNLIEFMFAGRHSRRAPRKAT